MPPAAQRNGGSPLRPPVTVRTWRSVRISPIHALSPQMTYYCSECVVNWWPYQATAGCCPRWGGGTSRRQEPASDDADDLFSAARAEAERRDRHARFEA